MSDLLFESRLPRSTVFGFKTYIAKGGFQYFVTSERVPMKDGISYNFLRAYSIRKVSPEGVTNFLPGTTRGQFSTGQKAHKYANDQGLGIPYYEG